MSQLLVKNGPKVRGLEAQTQSLDAVPVLEKAVADRQKDHRSVEQNSKSATGPKSATGEVPTPTRGRSVAPFVALTVFLLMLAFVGFRYFATASQVPADLVLPGNIDVRQVNLSFKVSGRVESLSADEGDSLKAGQVYGTLEKRYFEDSLRLAEAQRDQARANLDRLKNGSRPEEIDQARAQSANNKAALVRAEQDYTRAQQLIEKKVITPADYDVTKAAYLEAQAALKATEASQRLVEIGPRVEDIAAGRAQLDAAEAQVIVSQRQLTDAELFAPHDGVILTRAREIGAIVNAGETVATLTLSSPVWMRTYISEMDLGSIQPGMEVAVMTDKVAGRQYKGKIGFISSTAEFTPKAVETRELRTSLVYRVRIVIEDPDGGLRQGMPVTATIDLPGMRQLTVKERLLEALGLGR